MAFHDRKRPNTRCLSRIAVDCRAVAGRLLSLIALAPALAFGGQFMAPTRRSRRLETLGKTVPLAARCVQPVLLFRRF